MSRVTKFRELSPDDLRAREHELAEQLFRLRFQRAVGQLDAPHRIREIRRDLARVKTLLKELDQEAGTGGRG